MNKLLLIILSFTIFSCQNHPEPKKMDCCKTEKKAEPKQSKSDESVYNLSSSWTTQNNESIQLQHFTGKIVVAAMIFTHCESACPRIVSDIQRIEKAIPENEMDQIQFLLISMDPERDSPERMKEFAVDHKINPRWTLISSRQNETMEIANVLGVKFKKLDNGGFDHSNTIHVLDQNGIIVFQQNGFVIEQDELLEAIRKLEK